MLTNAKIIAFLATSNPGAARAFYESQLGLTLVSEDGFAIVFRAGEVDLRVQKLARVDPAPQTVLGWSVVSIEETVGALTKTGVSFERFSGLEQSALGIWTSPSGAKIAWFKDPDANILSLTQLHQNEN